ncbi:isochorismatase family cysteine hydrolase [Rapidithrix thailandica]|uniref:Isochorismatase family cysteine hydrolase n=1 Tax=Rapidithrix thailandica TaxID=413964 RepID=A0AAW9S3M2_9BACT
MKANGDNINIGKKDPLKEYYSSIVQTDTEERIENLANRDVALLLIDLQYLDAARGYGVFQDILASGIPPEHEEYYFRTLENQVLPNVQKLLKAFRKNRLEIIHIRIQSLTLDGRDRSNGHKRLGLHAAPGSKEAEFLEEVTPLENEIVINKTASGVFSSTNINYVLKNLGINELVVAGVYTNECVETTVRDACDLGYLVSLVEDACTTVTKELHQASITTLKDRYASVVSTMDIEERVEENVTEEIKEVGGISHFTSHTYDDYQQ